MSDEVCSNRKQLFPQQRTFTKGAVTSALCRFCCRNRHTDGAGRLVDFLKPSIVTRWIVRATYALLTLATLTQRTERRMVAAGRPTWPASGGSAQSPPA